MLGWFYFTAVAVWYVLIGRTDADMRILHFLLLALLVVGCSVSGFYLWVLFAKMPVKCMWCIVAHGINFILLLGTILLTPRAIPVVVTPAGPATDAKAVPEAPLYPGGRLIVATALCVMLAILAESLFAGFQTSRAAAVAYERAAAGYKADIDRMLEDTDTQWAMFRAQKEDNLQIRPDDPKRGDVKPSIPMVVFADFQCPPCKTFTQKTEKELMERLDQHVAVYWKHLPWGKDCNPRATTNIHPNACTAAYAAEAARIQGGNDVFWQAHDRLFEKQNELGTLDYRQFAKDLGLDADRFMTDMDSAEVKQRIKEDVELANRLQITSTPTVYIWNRKVGRYLLGIRPFVDELRKVVDQSISKTASPAHTPSPSPAATESSN
jgi:protein-disulfide isomerase